MYPGKITLLQSFLWRFTDVIGSAWKLCCFYSGPVCATNMTHSLLQLFNPQDETFGRFRLHSVFEQIFKHLKL